MNLDVFWERIFSGEEDAVRAAWDSLAEDERYAVRDFLARAQSDEQRAPAQRAAARFATGVADVPPAGAVDRGGMSSCQSFLEAKVMSQTEASFTHSEMLSDSARRDGSMEACASRSSAAALGMDRPLERVLRNCLRR